MNTHHQQLCNRNVIEFSDMCHQFHELNSVYDNQFTMYLDSNGWELFDLRIGRTILKNDFKHFRQFTSDMRRLMNNIVNVGMANILVNRNIRPKQEHVWSIKALIKLYGLTDTYLFNTNLQNYVNYGFKQKTEIMANSY